MHTSLHQLIPLCCHIYLYLFIYLYISSIYIIYIIYIDELTFCTTAAGISVEDLQYELEQAHDDLKEAQAKLVLRNNRIKELENTLPLKGPKVGSRKPDVVGLGQRYPCSVALFMLLASLDLSRPTHRVRDLL